MSAHGCGSLRLAAIDRAGGYQLSALCEWFARSADPDSQEVIRWPALSRGQVGLLRAIGVWPSAVQDEETGGRLLRNLAIVLRDGPLREAILVQSAEELRHASVLRSMTSAYSLWAVPAVVQKEVPPPEDEDFLRFGYSECVHFLAGCGFFEIASREKAFPAEFLAVFDRILNDEARHVAFFLSLMAEWWGRSPWHPVRIVSTCRSYAHAIGGLGSGRGGRRRRRRGAKYAVSGWTLRDVGVGVAIGACIAGHDRRMSRIDPRFQRRSFAREIVEVLGRIATARNVVTTG